MQKEQMETKLINFEDGQLLGIKTKEGEIYLGVKKVCDDLGLTEGQARRQVANINKDIVLRNGCGKIKIPIETKNQIIQKHNSICLEIKYLPIWLSKINTQSLTEEQYKKIMKLLNWCLSSDFENLKKPLKTYSFESHLRDEIYNIGYFDNIKIIDKEVFYNFGRIDLLGKDNENRKICIELKKYKEFNDTKEQLLKYKNSEIFDKIIYCAYKIDESLRNWCKNNNIQCYTYSRELTLQEV
ncbi:endonuclease NucS domain-containing protein [Clostridium sporogenes]|uniref:endonuclease NucS domain-containing protein n=1 Tax=Clostridium sporogenes TaxID=1509 RepID=UPI001FABB1A2|nr:endonuclease NucS domain-containing protein [Clostridium sporogenes]